MTNSKVVGTTDCPLYEAIAFQMPKIAPKMVLAIRKIWKYLQCLMQSYFVLTYALSDFKTILI